MTQDKEKMQDELYKDIINYIITKDISRKNNMG